MLRAALAEGVEPPPALHSEDIAGAVIYALGAPQHVQVTSRPPPPYNERFESELFHLEVLLSLRAATNTPQCPKTQPGSNSATNLS
ncbi:unnamed protein product [Timema podura]|uniref:Uncharacterized protein n=1 Tax=Timema podura TaxID=61482 RepID=A0ABN7NTT6_TIMPD|nr:unnamed protein product [Timema podura]